MSSEFHRRASLVLNVFLAGAVTVIVLHKLAPASARSAIEVNPETTANEVGPGKMANDKPDVAEEPKLPRYGDIKSASDRRRAIIDQLREIGVPNDLLALVARVDFEVQWDSRFEACKGDMDKLAAVQQEMYMSKDAEMRAALGEEGFRQWDQKTMLWEAMSTEVDVTPSEAVTIYDLKKKLQQFQRDMEQARLKGTMDDAEINAACDKAYSEYYQKLKAVLGEERYTKSQQLDDAFVAGNLQHELAKVHPSDSQFQGLFKAEQELTRSRLELDHEFNGDPSSPEFQAKMRALNDAHDQEYQRVLGTNAFYSLKQQEDPGYIQMKKYETYWGLDDSKIDFVYATMKSYEKSLQDYQARLLALQAQGQSMDVDTVKNTLQQLTDKARQSLQNSLGQDTFNRLQRNRVFQFNPTPSPHGRP